MPITIHRVDLELINYLTLRECFDRVLSTGTLKLLTCRKFKCHIAKKLANDLIEENCIGIIHTAVRNVQGQVCTLTP